MRQRGIDAATVRGTGPNGRIVLADVPETARPAPFKAAAQSGSISPMRRAVAAKVAASFATVPHFYLETEADVTELVELRQQVLASVEKSHGLRPSLTDYLLLAVGRALREHPQANRIWQDGAIVPLPDSDVGMVVQVDDGLMTPVLRGVDRLCLTEVARQRTALAASVRSGKTSADQFHGGATSLTNLGRHRVDRFAPIISPPQSSMLAVGRVCERPAAFQRQICLRQRMCLTLAVDHRVMDGVPAAEFLDRIVELLETPALLV